MLELKEPISFAHIDCDWYESVKCVLKYVMPNLLVNGIVIIDDYNCWQGTNKAVDEYFQNIKDQFEFYFINKKLHIKRIKTNKMNNIQNQVSNCSHENHYPILHQYIKSKYIPLNILSSVVLMVQKLTI